MHVINCVIWAMHVTIQKTQPLLQPVTAVRFQHVSVVCVTCMMLFTKFLFSKILEILMVNKLL